jgi:small subunit ribosomal protein S8
MLTDTIADMLTRIRNAQMVKKEWVEVPFSRFKYDLAKILEKEGFLKEVRLESRGKFKKIKIVLKYLSDNQPAIRSIRRISKPGRRIYVKKHQIPKVLGGLGLMVISTSQGLMTDKEARKRSLGGELICEVY